MKQLDRYILGIFLKTFFFSLFLFTLIATAIDVSEKSEEFIRNHFTAKQVISQYYIGFIPHIVTLLFPVFVLVSVVFFTSRLAMRTEIVAMLSTGMSLGRILRPFFIGGIFLALLLGFSNHYLIPPANKIRTDFEMKYIYLENAQKVSNQYLNNLHFRIDSFTYAGLRSFDTLAKRGYGFYLSRVSGNQMSYNLRSESITWLVKEKEWQLENAIERKINGLQEEVVYHPSFRIKIGYIPVDLTTDEYRKDKLKTPELNRLIQNEKRRGSEGVPALLYERYRRDANAASVIVMTLIAGILASRKIRGGSGVHLAVAFIIGVAFILVDKFSMVFCVKGNFNPMLAAWMATLVFGLVTVVLYKRSPQ